MVIAGMLLLEIDPQGVISKSLWGEGIKGGGANKHEKKFP